MLTGNRSHGLMRSQVEITVGNGTRARIQYHYWQLTNGYGTYNYYILDGVRILDLVERQEIEDSNSDS